MRFFHLSDLHIGLKLMNRDLREDQAYIFDKIAEYAGQYRPDAIVIAGDIYDKSIPSAEAVDLFDAFVQKLTETAPETEIMMISGNHDSASRVNVFRNVLRRQRIHMIGMPPVRPEEYIEKVTLRDEHGPVNFYLLPFVRPSMVREITGYREDGSALSYDEAVHRLIERENIEQSERNVLVSHQFYLPVGADADKVERMDSEIRTVGNIDEIRADVLGAFDYAALGHIHKPMKVGDELYRYCGTPLACSVSEAGQQKGIIMVDLAQKGETVTTVLPLIPLHEVKVIRGPLEDVVLRACDDYVTVVLTDTVDLDVLDMQDRIRDAFPRLLEIRREAVREEQYSLNPEELSQMPEPFELCCAFYAEISEEEKELLRDIINTVQGA